MTATPHSQAIWILLELRTGIFKELCAQVIAQDRKLPALQGFDMLTHAIKYVANPDSYKRDPREAVKTFDLADEVAKQEMKQ